MTEKVGRNDPCPCGSGKKYKSCCMHAQPVAAPKYTADGKRKFKAKVIKLDDGSLSKLASATSLPHVPNSEGGIKKPKFLATTEDFRVQEENPVPFEVPETDAPSARKEHKPPASNEPFTSTSEDFRK